MYHTPQNVAEEEICALRHLTFYRPEFCLEPPNGYESCDSPNIRLARQPTIMQDCNPLTLLSVWRQKSECFGSNTHDDCIGLYWIFADTPCHLLLNIYFGQLLAGHLHSVLNFCVVLM